MIIEKKIIKIERWDMKIVNRRWRNRLGNLILKREVIILESGKMGIYRNNKI